MPRILSERSGVWVFQWPGCQGLGFEGLSGLRAQGSKLSVASPLLLFVPGAHLLIEMFGGVDFTV